MSLLASSRMELGWNYPKLNALFNAVTNYRNKMMKGIISSFKNYDQVRLLVIVLNFFLVNLLNNIVFCNRTKTINVFGSITGLSCN
jgi:hypothetical protein